ncbi:hypothetical protein CHLRE_09g409050v5 [Chlamydomonas reinhardtii]|uniref:Ubiquitin thioesterase OTU n=1 Tax=Chlamydomonas reinhardtii TaxID=3055 RepID=A0A2K3DFG9_CHLRE|nr:uncharacterized protein CHLRE_09g409050v5 [Chlamydomonas reinhardtii]PNW79281.1 hypothetical protein CHLRE_09g409050v5 [Chlamydomonas reinhardtii]
MSSLTLRCRGPSGQATVSVDAASPIADFLALLAEKTGVPAACIEILSGFPPKQIQVPSEGAVSALGLANGDTLTVRQGAAPALPPAAALPPVAPQSEPSSSGAGAATHSAAAGAGAGALGGFADMEDEDEMLARAIAASLESQQSGAGAGASGAGVSGAGPAATPRPAGAAPGAALAAPSSGAPRSVTNAPAGGPAPSSVPVPGGDGSCVVRRVVDSDNSCLFNAVGYVMEGSRSTAARLRRVVADAVRSDPFTFNEGFLGKAVEVYCDWIQQPDKWGGAIELFILAQHYKREIAAFDIRTKRCDIYGQDKGYPDRVLLIYDGLHYDALAVAAFAGAPEELDVTCFEPDTAGGRAITAAAEKLVEATNAARQFTDTANFTLRCGVCQIGIKGEKEAVEHAKATGHSNFAEY